MNYAQFESYKRLVNAETNVGVLFLHYMQMEGLATYGPAPLRSRIADLQTTTGKRINALDMVKELTKTSDTVDPINTPQILNMDIGNEPLEITDEHLIDDDDDDDDDEPMDIEIV
jgi:hypothetical protein